MSLRPGADPLSAMPDLEPGDRLLISAEVEVTTDCKKQQDDCVGTPYRYDPTVKAQLVLARNREVTEAAPGEGVRISGGAVAEKCSHDEHHKVLVFSGLERSIPKRGFPWPLEDTCINLILEAYHPSAIDDHFLLVGENDPGGKVGQDKGRLNVVRLRGEVPPPAPKSTSAKEVPMLPVDPEAKTVVYSLPIGKPEEGEQLEVKAELGSTAEHLGYPARISTRLYLTDNRYQTDLGGEAKRVAAFGGEIGEHNGFNCLPDAGVRRTRRVGVLRIIKTARKPLFVNLVATSGDPLKKGAPGDELELVDPGFLEVVRYPAELKG